jgi:amino acid transporter
VILEYGEQLVLELVLLLVQEFCSLRSSIRFGAGRCVIFSFIIAGITALLTGLSSAEPASFITEEGGSYIYTTKAFGKFPEKKDD